MATVGGRAEGRWRNVSQKNKKNPTKSQNHKAKQTGKQTNKQKELTKGTTLPDPSVSVIYMLSAFLHRK